MQTSPAVAAESAKQLSRFVSAARSWKKKCDELSAARKAGDPARYEAATVSWRKGRIPSKASKHRAYDAAARLNSFIAATTGVSLPRAETVDDLAATLAAFRAL